MGIGPLACIVNLLIAPVANVTERRLHDHSSDASCKM